MDAGGTEILRVPTRRSHYGVASPEKRGMTVQRRDGIVVLGMGEIEIWDSADLALLRETLLQLITKRGSIAVGIDIRFVKGLPSGFFGMLCSWLECRGVHAVYLFAPQPSVRQMLWFRLFFQSCDDEGFVMLKNPQMELLEDDDDSAPVRRDVPRQKSRLTKPAAKPAANHSGPLSDPCLPCST